MDKYIFNNRYLSKGIILTIHAKGFLVKKGNMEMLIKYTYFMAAECWRMCIKIEGV